MFYDEADTIAALITPAGTGATGALRVSGADTVRIIAQIFKPVKKLEHGKFYYGNIVDGETIVDDVIISFFENPKSYTGEDVIEISAHGSPVILNRILQLITSMGARTASAGEFTYRAFINGKMDLNTAESVAALIAGKTESAAKAARNTLSGGLTKLLQNFKEAFLKFRAVIELNLDHSEHETTTLTQPEKLQQIETFTNTVNNFLNMYRVSKLLETGVKAAIVGKPNTGKSSLLNAILKRERAIVTEVAGTTTDTIEETINLNGIPLTIIDTAGIREHSSNAIEILGQQKTLAAANDASIIICLFDGSAPLSADDNKIIELVHKFHGTVICVISKSDLPQVLSTTNIKNLIRTPYVLSASSQKAESIQNLLAIVYNSLNTGGAGENPLFINARHYRLLVKIANSLEKMRQTAETINADEIIAVDAQTVLSALNEILGINAPDDILETVFANFCVGK